MAFQEPEGYTVTWHDAVEDPPTDNKAHSCIRTADLKGKTLNTYLKGNVKLFVLNPDQMDQAAYWAEVIKK